VSTQPQTTEFGPLSRRCPHCDGLLEMRAFDPVDNYHPGVWVHMDGHRFGAMSDLIFAAEQFAFRMLHPQSTESDWQEETETFLSKVVAWEYRHVTLPDEVRPGQKKQPKKPRARNGGAS
jgi:hypothetical protein